MRAVLHLMATMALLPYVLLATAFLLLEQAISAGTLTGFFAALLADASELIVLFPCMGVAVYGAWVLFDELRSRRVDRGAIKASA